MDKKAAPMSDWCALILRSAKRTTARLMRRLLLISHYFPPSGGGGVQRPAYFVKHLGATGWNPVVLTSDNLKDQRWAPPDFSLAAVVPGDVTVVRVASAIRLGMREKARVEERLQSFCREARKLIETARPDAILVTMSPFSDAAVGSRLSAHYGIPWIADLRDPWALDEFQVYRTRWHRAAARNRMWTSLRSASTIIMNTPEAASRVRALLPQLSRTPLVSITNGFAIDDFPNPLTQRRGNKFRIVHSGTFHVELGLTQRRRAFEYRVLGRTEPGVELLPRSHYFLLRALEQFLTEDTTAAQWLEVVCLGVATAADTELVRNSPAGELFRITGYLPHSETVQHVRSADLLFLPMHKVAQGTRATIVPGKTYEYMASGRPILAAVPEGDCRDFLRQCGTADLCKPDDVSAMKSIIKRRYNDWKQGSPMPVQNIDFVAQFERRNLAGQLASILDQAIGPIASRQPR